MVVETFASPVGPLVAAGDDDGIWFLEFQRADPPVALFGRPCSPGTHPHLDRLRRELEEYFDGRRRAFEVPIRLQGTPFQLRVWSALTTIPYSETRSYLDIARALGDAKAVRAVGAANGRNPISIVVPCHRVIGSDGSIVGYGGGLDRKAWLLAHERGERRLFKMVHR